MDRQCKQAVVRGVLRRSDGAWLIVQTQIGGAAAWMLPGTTLTNATRPADALRQWCLAMLGLELDTLLPQPPLGCHVGGRIVTVHLLTCPVARDTAAPVGGATIRWVRPGQLVEHDLTALDAQILPRLLSAC